MIKFPCGCDMELILDQDGARCACGEWGWSKGYDTLVAFRRNLPVNLMPLLPIRLKTAKEGE